jgi:hypothetical protein
VPNTETHTVEATVAKTKSEIITDITNYVRNNGGKYSGWYAGIAADARDRMFNGHAVQEKGDAWIYRECANATTAREVEDHLIKLGMDGGPGGGDSSTKFAYAYRKTSSTVE